MNSFSNFVSVAIVMSLAGSCFAQEGQSATPPKSLADDYIIGEWTMDGAIGDKSVKGNMRVRTGAGDTCVIFNWMTRSRGEEPLRGTAVGGFDPKTKEWVECCFESDGSHYMARYAPENDDADVGTGHGDVSGTFNGKPYAGKITVERKGRDHFIYSVEATQGKNWRFSYRRVKEGEAKTKKK